MTCEHKSTEFYGYVQQEEQYTITKVCCECLLHIEHAASEHEIELITQYRKEKDGIHDVAKSFVHEVLNQPSNKIQLAEVWSLNYPGHVKIINVDDQSHMTSILVLIDHKTDINFMGTSVYFIDQQDNINKFFMYPRSMKKMLKALSSIYSDFNKVDEVTQDRYLRFHTAMNSG